MSLDPKFQSLLGFEKNFNPNEYCDKSKGHWSDSEHNLFIKTLRDHAQFQQKFKWIEIEKIMQSRSAAQCQMHYYKLKKKLDYDDVTFRRHLLKESKTAAAQFKEQTHEYKQSHKHSTRSKENDQSLPNATTYIENDQFLSFSNEILLDMLFL